MNLQVKMAFQRFTMALKTDREKCAHLLRRFGLGASEAELDYYLQGGFQAAKDRLLNYEKVEEEFSVGFDDLEVPDRPVPPQAVIAWWAARMVATRRPLAEKMTLFWHDHFATSFEKVRVAPAMFAQNETLRRNATGNFRTLLHEVSKDPAMLFWLDNQTNVKGRPNENFAREVMELFTLGIGHYSEKDVQEAARAFTGWSVGRAAPGTGVGTRAAGRSAFIFRRALHDDGEKTVLGKTGNLTGEDVLDHLCSLPRTAEYITTKIWEWFAYPKPDAALVKRLSATLVKNDLEIKALLKAIMDSPEFYSEKAERGIYKTPADFCITIARQLGLGASIVRAQNLTPRAAVGPGQSLGQVMKNMGMWLMYPPDVAGWEGGSSWISTATMLERIRFADRLFGVNRSGGPNFRVFQAIDLFGAGASAESVVDKMASIFDAPLNAAKRSAITEAVRKEMGTGLTARNANEVAATATRLIFATPEFQFA